MPNKPQSTNTQLAVIVTEIGYIKQEVRDIKSGMTEGYVPMAVYKVEVGSLRKLVYWLLGLVGTVLAILITAFVGLVVAK